MKSIGLALLAVSSFCISAADYTVRIESGEQALENVIITARLPQAEKGLSWRSLLGPDGRHIPLGGLPSGEAVFVLPKIEAQSVKTYTLSPRVVHKASDEVLSAMGGGKVTITDAGKKVFTYQGSESELPRPDINPLFKRGGYIHPLYSPSGKLLTDDYPPDHIHHHGIWFAWTKTSFEGRSPDFWNMGEAKGKVEFVHSPLVWQGPVAGFHTQHRFLDLTAPQPKAALNETWTVTAYHIPGADYFTFDLVSTQTCASASPLILPKYHYGGLGFRGNWAWNGKEKTRFLTSEGETDRIKGNETRGNWCHIGGEVDGVFTGVAILSHPDNFRSPQPMRLHPTEPFFCFAPSQLGDWKIEPGKPYVSRYRFVVLDGQPSKERIDEFWRAYAHPPKVVPEKH